MKVVGVALSVRKDERIDQLIGAAVGYLRAHPGFDGFDRLHFITAYISPLQKRIGTGLFDRNFLKVDSFYRQQYPSNAAMVQLGKKLFFENAISGNGKRSCGSCHQPEKYFTDGLPKSTTLDGHGTVPRNAPTLLYAAYQYSQDWDGKARSIEEQVVNVMHNKDEMAADSATVIATLERSSNYSGLFQRAFSGHPAISITNLATAVAAYVRTLAPFNSAFDRYMQGDHKAMSAAQKSGFNLFMGKAQCGTCHFAPVFNGLTPPDYKATEYEVLGTPLTGDLKHPRIDPDLGRAASYPSRYYRMAFKTPTVRNIAKTGPYMHNGSFHNLQTVLDFYNKGGAQGIGLNVPEQSLSAEPLKLSPKEINHIIAFLHTLTDHP